MKVLANAHISRAILEFLRSAGRDCLRAELVGPGMADDGLPTT